MGQVGQYALRPFSNPHRPVNPMTATEQLRGNDNQTAKAFTEHDADVSIHTVTSDPVSVASGVGAVAIYSAVTGLAYGLVSGDDGAGKTFVDQVVWNGATNVVVAVTSTAVDGAPAARTYTVVASVLKVAMAAGTYDVSILPLQL